VCLTHKQQNKTAPTWKIFHDFPGALENKSNSSSIESIENNRIFKINKKRVSFLGY
jgi:hypothetical protein